jgi:hypothetical protein
LQHQQAGSSKVCSRKVVKEASRGLQRTSVESYFRDQVSIFLGVYLAK